MTVAELVAELQKLDQSLPVCQRVAEGDDHDFLDTERVEVREVVFDDEYEERDADGDPLPKTCAVLEYM